MATVRANRFWSMVQKTDGCWQWTGRLTPDGYGRIGGHSAHRRAYQLVIGPIPEGLELDHLCRNTACVNPAHLEPVTRDENARRRAALVTHCKSGHEYTPENTYWWRNQRTCRACNREHKARARRRHIGSSAAVA